MTIANSKDEAKLGKLLRFTSDCSDAADSLRHLADLVEQGVIVAAAGVFIDDETWSEFIHFDSGASKSRIVGALSLLNFALLKKCADTE